MGDIEKWRIYIGVIHGLKFFLMITISIPNMGTQRACPHGYNTYMVVISMSSLATKEHILLVTCITRIFKEIITLIKLSSVLPVSAILWSI